MAAPRILVVEDDGDLCGVISVLLKRVGYEVAAARTGEAGLAAAEARRPDLIILDVMLPKLDGFEFLRRLRRRAETPVIFLTAKSGEMDRIVGLRLGADDYVAKPFSPEELVARVGAVLHRTLRAQDGHTGAVRYGTLEVDLERCEVRVDGHPRELTPKEFDLLACLVKADGKPLSREQLLERVWGYEKGLELSTRTVDQHVARLRRRLRSERRRIVTVAKRGYRLDTT